MPGSCTKGAAPFCSDCRIEDTTVVFFNLHLWNMSELKKREFDLCMTAIMRGAESRRHNNTGVTISTTNSVACVVRQTFPTPESDVSDSRVGGGAVLQLGQPSRNSVAAPDDGGCSKNATVP